MEFFLLERYINVDIHYRTSIYGYEIYRFNLMTMLYYFFRVMTVISQATKEGHDGSLGKNESRLERIQVITITQLFVSSDFEVEN